MIFRAGVRPTRKSRRNSRAKAKKATKAGVSVRPAAGEENLGEFAARSWDFAEFQYEFQYEWDHQPPKIIIN